MTIPEQARAVAALKVIADLVKDQHGTEKEGLLGALRDLGVRGGVEAAMPDGTPLGTVGITQGRLSAQVDDLAALTAWVEENHPSEIEVVRRVRPAYITKLLNGAKSAGAPIDLATGEAVPGLAVGEGEAFLSVRLSSAAPAAVLAALGAGYQPIALPSGEAPA